MILAVVVGLLAVPGWSLGRTLSASSPDPVGVRGRQWAREPSTRRLGQLRGTHVVFAPPAPQGWNAERRDSGRAEAERRATRHRATTHDGRAGFVAPKNIVPLVANPLPGEGVWQPSGRLVAGRPALWITYLRPDAVHTSLLAGVAHFDMSHSPATLHAGTDVPGGGPWVHGAQVAVGDYPYVVAAFQRCVPPRQQSRWLLRRRPHR